MKSSIGVIILLILLVTHLFSQDSGDLLLEEMISTYAESSDLVPNEEEVTFYVNQGKKININRLGPDDFLKIPFLTPLQAKNLAEYIKQYGELFSFYELQAVEGFDSSTIQQLIPYIEIGAIPPRVKITPKNLIREGHHEVLFRYGQVLQRQEGYQKNDTCQVTEQKNLYLGSPQSYYFRYRYTFSDKILIGISGEKDAGEEFFKGSQSSGMDFYSGFLSIGNHRWLRELVVGNFRASFGQGLTLGGNSFGSSVSFGSAMQYNAGFTPSQSVCEYGYLRGVAVTLSAGPFEWDGFFSFAWKDALVILSDTGERENPSFSSFTETGYHRTQSELDLENRVQEQVYGGHMSYRGGRFIIGLTGFYGRWNGVLQPKQEVYKRFMLQGNKFGGFGIDGRCRIGFAQLFGEFSVSLNGGRAWLLGCSAIPLQGIDLLVILRSYQPEYQNPFATAISQNALTANEQGVFIRLQTQLLSKITISGYADLYRFPWLRYQVHSPSDGFEAGLFGHYQASPYWSCSLRYSIKKGEVNSSSGEYKMVPLTEESRSDLKAEFNLSPIPALTLRSCFVLRNYRDARQQREWGYLGGQEITVRIPGVFRVIRLNYALFDIPYYHARIYLYEPDLIYSFSAPAYYGKGIRMVFLVQAGIFRKVDLWVWLGMSKFMDRTVIGSGLDAINGSLKSEVKIQVRVRL